MSEPFIYIATYGIKPEFLDVAPQRLRDVAALVEEREPQLRSFHFYLDPERGRAICVQVHADAESMATHMATIAEHLSTAWDWLDLNDTEHVTVFLTNMEDFATMNRLYAEAFATNRPTRTTVEVSRLPTPIAIELKVIATA